MSDIRRIIAANPVHNQGGVVHVLRNNIIEFDRPNTEVAQTGSLDAKNQNRFNDYTLYQATGDYTFVVN